MNIRHGGALPALPVFCISMYVGDGPRAELASRLADVLRASYGSGQTIAAKRDCPQLRLS